MSSATKTRKDRTFRASAYLEDLMAELDRAGISRRIAQAREEAGLTQPEMGDALTPSVHFRTIQNWESLKDKRIPWDRLDEIGRLTGVSKDWLLHGRPPVDEDPAVTERLDRIESMLEALVAQVGRAGQARSQ
jgi:transcriptional regulator with XRE-family HTH domain